MQYILVTEVGHVREVMTVVILTNSDGPASPFYVSLRRVFMEGICFQDRNKLKEQFSFIDESIQQSPIYMVLYILYAS